MKASIVMVLALPLVLAASSSFAGHGHGGGHGYGHGGSVSVYVGPRYVRPYFPFVSTAIGFGLGYSAGLYSGYPYDRWDYPSRPVIVEHRTVIERPVQDDDVVTYESRPAERHSLLRDLQGRCYERSYDHGQETRVELDPSACNF